MIDYIPGSFSDVWANASAKAIWELLTQPHNVLRMETAAKLGRPAVEAVADLLESRFGQYLSVDRHKQMVGHMVRQIMEATGHSLESAAQKVRVGTTFTKAARYRSDMAVAVSRLPLRYKGTDHKVVEAGIRNGEPFAKVSPPSADLVEAIKESLLQHGTIRVWLRTGYCELNT